MVFWSFYEFKVYFGHFGVSVGILVIFEVTGLF